MSTEESGLQVIERHSGLEIVKSNYLHRVTPAKLQGSKRQEPAQFNAPFGALCASLEFSA